MAQGRSTKIITMIKWIGTSRLSIKNPLSLQGATMTSSAALAANQVPPKEEPTLPYPTLPYPTLPYPTLPLPSTLKPKPKLKTRNPKP